MVSGKILTWLRTGTLLYFLIAACATIFAPVDNGVKAPLLTLMGGASIVVVFFPLEFRRITLGTALGTVIAMFGSGTWYADSTQGESASIIEFLFPITVILTLVFVGFSVILSIRETIQPNPKVHSMPRNGRNSFLVFGTLSIIFLFLHIIRSSLERKKHNDAIG